MFSYAANWRLAHVPMHLFQKRADFVIHRLHCLTLGGYVPRIKFSKEYLLHSEEDGRTRKYMRPRY